MHSSILRIRAAAVFLIVAATLSSAQTKQTPPALSLIIEPSFDLPIASSELFTAGGSMMLGAELSLGSAIPPFVSVMAGYSISPFRAENVMHTLLVGPGAGLYFDFSNRLSLKLLLSGGYYYSFVDDGGTIVGGGNPYVLGGIGLQFLLAPRINLGAGVTWRQLFGLQGGLDVTLGTSYFLTGQDRRQLRMEGRLPTRLDLLQERTPNPNEGIRIDQVDFETVFPVFRNWYDTNPLGTAVLTNQDKVPVTNLRASLKIQNYMDASKELAVPATLKPGETAVVDLHALLNLNVMSITQEGEKAPAELTLTYNVGDQRFRDVKTRTVSFWNRNNMNWDDNRRAAAFVTKNDPRIVELASNILKAVDTLQTVAMSKPLLVAMAVHQATLQNGVRYQVDPKSSYKVLSGQKAQVDFLKYPVQTLSSSGDCDDLSILYAAALEACGVDTAFVTVPGHIFVAFAIPVAEAEAQKTYFNASNIVKFNDRFWVPLETTLRDKGFTEAWKTGADQWKQYAQSPAFGMYPLDEAWLRYNAVQAPENIVAAASVKIPGVTPLQKAVMSDMDAFIASELTPLIAKLEKDPKAKDDPAIINRIGVLYAKYGLLDKAVATFKRITAMKDNSSTFSAYLNLGNVSYLRENFPEALSYYQQASMRNTDNALAKISIARASFALGKFDEARVIYEKLAASDPKFAEQYSYLGAKAGDQGERASGAAAQKGVSTWDD